jgi:predicted transcriptional regulator
MKQVRDLHKKWLKDPEYKREYESLEEEFDLAKTLVQARMRAKLTQSEVAELMSTSQGSIARLEGGNANPSIETLKRNAIATGAHLKIEMECALRT